MVEFPEALRHIPAAEAMRDLQLQGQVPDTHRFLRLVAKLGCGLAAPLQKDLRQAAEKIFAAAGWMERMAVWAQSEQGFTLNVTRVYCSAVCIFHRRGLPELALQAVEALRARNAEVPICTLSLAIDACLQAGWSDKACELFKEAKMLVSQKLAAAQQNEAVEEADVEDSDSDAEKPGKDGDPCPEPEESSLRTDGMPPWLSPREGHLVALIACHVAILNHLALHPGYWTGEAPAEPKPGAFSAVSLVRDGLEVVQSACSLAEKPCPGASALLGQIDGLGRRRQKALRLLLAPCARLTQLPEAEPELAELVTGAGLEAASLATAGLMETAAVQRVEDFGDEISEQDALDVRSNVLSLLRRLERPLCREDLDEQIRAMGRRKIKRPGMILQTFRVMAQLAARGQSALEPGVAKAMRHMAPDQDSCAATVEALFACGSVDAAEEIYRRCRAALLPNPALYSAMIFGRLACGDGDGATEAMLDMAAAGFTPHQRFLSRSLRFMGPFHNQGLLLVERLGLPHLQQKLLHVLMEACNNSPNPAESALEVYRFMAKEWVPTPDTHFAMLKALCGTEVDLAICELRSFQAQEVLPPHPGFELLLRECFGLANRRHRACLVMEARRAWVEEVSAMAPCELRHLVTMGQELQKRMEAIVPETKEHYWDAEQVWEADPEADQYAEEGQADRPRKCSEDGDPAMLDDSCFGPNCCYRWVLETYCYVVWRYSLVRSGVQKALLQQELDQALTGDHARIGSQLHSELLQDCICQVEGEAWEPLGFVLLVAMQLSALEVLEGTQIRLLRMLFRALPAANRNLEPKHVTFIEKEAYQLSPGVLTELLSICASLGLAPFSSPEARQSLADIAQNYYLKRGSGEEPIKLSTALRFVRTHNLIDLLAEDVLFVPVMCAFNDGQPQHAYNLGEGEPELQLKMISYAIRKGHRLAAGRLVDRFGLPEEELPDWPGEHGSFRDACGACVREAEEAEATELRAASNRKMAAAAEEEGACLQLPEHVASQVMVISTPVELRDVAKRLLALASLADADSLPTTLATPGRVLGLDAEWKPFLEKRGGMQKHRRSTQTVAAMEPCSTLQVAADDFVAIFDLLALTKEATIAHELSNLLGALFAHPKIVKLGFGLQNDLQRLAASYPQLACFRCMRATLDVQEAFMALRRNKGQSTGLSALCTEHFGAPLSKRLQTSDWSARPLSREQVLYAALDAFCLLGLARNLPESAWQDLEVQSIGQKLVVASSRAGGYPVAAADAEEIAAVDSDIAAKGLEIRSMKAQGKPKSAWQAEVAILLQLKAKYKELAGCEWVPALSA
ncbi:unnamed protein product [Effrenium voratum]|uniref:WHEP-TRS domain-containing protein n=1 Tax=Effrenium voratum TaxID=2562239 RepID=A0AA36JI19_9DINO|nr:unnamed protein product [Effrenium voratum]